MTPRRPDSKKWSSLPEELLQQIQQVFAENFAEASKKGQIMAEGRIYPTELMLRVGYLEKGRLAQANFEVSLDYNRNKENVMRLILLAVDCAASMMMDYLAEGESADEDQVADLPRTWMPFDVEGRTIYLQFTTENPSLEAEADRLLGEAGEKQLVHGANDEEDEEENLKAVITMLGLDEDLPEDSDLKSNKSSEKKKPQSH